MNKQVIFSLIVAASVATICLLQTIYITSFDLILPISIAAVSVFDMEILVMIAFSHMLFSNILSHHPKLNIMLLALIITSKILYPHRLSDKLLTTLGNMLIVTLIWELNNPAQISYINKISHSIPINLGICIASYFIFIFLSKILLEKNPYGLKN